MNENESPNPRDTWKPMPREQVNEYVKQAGKAMAQAAADAECAVLWERVVTQMRKLLEGIAEMDPMAHEGDCDDPYCFFCGGCRFKDEGHEDDCLWVRIRKQVGYFQ